MIVSREVDEFSIQEAEELVASRVKRDGYKFFLLVNKSACLFRNDEGKFGIVVGHQDGIQTPPDFRFSWVLLRAGTVMYEVGEIRID